MNHQLIDLWLHNPSELNAEQTSELHAHLQTCTECKRVYHGWESSASLIQSSGLVRAPAGFSARFQAGLAERRRREHRRQARIFLLILFGAILAASILLLVRFFSDHPPVQVLSQGIHFFSTAPQRLLEFRYIFSFWLGQVPPVYLIGAAIILSGWVFILLFGWVLTIMRITHQGVRQ